MESRELSGEGLELMEQLTPEQIDELLTNTEVTCLVLHTKRWKYYALCNLPYSVLKSHKVGRYEWVPVNPKNFEQRVIRLRQNWEELLTKEAK